MVFCFCFCAWSDADGQEKIREAVRKRDDAVQTLDGFYKRRMDQLEQEFVASVTKLNRSFIEKLEALKVQAAKDVELEAANKIDGMIKETESAETEIPETDVTATSQDEPEPDFRGNWIGKWGTNSRTLRVVVLKDNKVKVIDHLGKIQESEITKNNDRYLILKMDHHDLELVRAGDRLVVLGWSKSRDRHVMVDPANLMAVLGKAN